MSSGKAGLLVLLLALEGLAMTGAARQHLRTHPLSGAETSRKPRAADYVFSSCDFDSTDRPFCDWTQPQDSHGSLWLRELGQKPGNSPGPPEGDIVRREYYIHPGDGSARLESPNLDPAGAEVCVRFLYYLYSNTWKSQLAVEVQDASGSATPLWTRNESQSSSWLSGAVTVPAQAQRPFKVVFRATQVKGPDIEVAVDSILVQLGPCSPCVTKCDFDVLEDLCGWDNQQEGDMIWEQWNGPTEEAGVGPADDFSKPGFGFYMLLNYYNGDGESGGTAFLKSPTFSAPGRCLSLSFYYTLHGISDGTALKVYAAAPGGELGVPLLTLRGEHGPHWRQETANYTGRENIQFVFEGTLARKTGLAVDSVAISPCEETFAACDFNDNTDPFCGWSEPADNNVPWIRTNEGTPTEETGPPGDYPHGEGYYIFVEAGFMKPGQSVRLSSRPFCVNQEACIEFYYHMYSPVVVETELRVLLEGPSGTAVLLWSRTGTQSSSWLFGSVTVPYGGAQPSTVTFEVVRRSNPYLDVALDNISVRRGRCAAPPATPVPPSASSTASSTAGGPVVTVPPEQPTVPQPTTVTSSSPTTSSASTTTKPIVTKPHPTTLNSTGPTTTITPHSSASPGQGNQTTPGLPSSSETPSHATPISTQSSTVACPPQPSSTSQTSPPSPVTTSSVSTTTSVSTTSQVVPTCPSRPTVPPSSSSTTIAAGGGDPSPTTPTSASSTVPPSTTTIAAGGGDPSPTTPTSASSTVPPSTTTIAAGGGDPSPTTPTSASSTVPPSSTTIAAGGGDPSPTTPTSASSTVPPSTTTIAAGGGDPSPTTPTSASSTVPPSTTTIAAGGGDPSPTTPTSASSTVPPSTTTIAAGGGDPSPTTPTSASSTVPPSSTTIAAGGGDPSPTTPTSASSTVPPSTTTIAAGGGDPSPTTPTSASSTVPPSSTTIAAGGGDPSPTTPTSASSTVPPSTTTIAAGGGDPSLTTPTSASSTVPPSTTTIAAGGGDPSPTTPTSASSTVPPSSTTIAAGGGDPSPTTPTSASSTVPPSTTTIAAGGGDPSPTTPTSASSTVPPSTTTIAAGGGAPSPTTPTSASSTSIPGHDSSTTTTHVSSTTPSTRPPTDLSSSVQPSSPTTATVPTITIPTRTASTPKPTTKRPDPEQTTPEQPPDRAQCVVSGDPHYTTYDGRLFHFMGNCTYLLTAVCDATPGQPTFQVQTTNEHRGGNTQVSYLKSVSIAVYGTQIVLLKGRKVTVDGKRVTLPVSVASGLVSVRRSGTFVLVQTDFGLLVRFDGNHHAEVSVPSSYFGKLCGLCGNFNGQAADDNLMPNGTSAGADPNQLGESWQVPNVGDASCTNSGDPGECDPDIVAEAQGPSSCGILTDPQGPFAPCHGKVPPQGAFESCFYDLCGTGGDTGLLCSSLQSYADRCAQAGVTIVWRNSTFCPLNCPPGSSYTPCGSACPATCTDPESQDSCPALPCVEGCICDQGSVLSGDQCVPLSQCGCTDPNGHYHVAGDSWMENLDCTKRCTCAAGNQITCEEWSCTPVQECRPVDGLLGCQDIGVATCHVAGDPHYYTFDGKMVSFMGTCTYTLVSLCQHDPRLPAFNITAKNEERGQPEASYLRLVTIQLRGVTITLQKSRRVLIDGQRVRTPVEGRIPGVSITSRGIYVVLETDFGLMVKFDGNHHLEIQLPGMYFGKVCGMCGNFNNQSADDYLMPNGNLAANDTQFGNSWKAPGDADPGCQSDDRLDLHPNCSRQELERLHVLCLEIMEPKYQSCHSVIDPKLFFQNCLYDMCEYQGMTSVLCDNIQAYVEACKSQGVTNISWRNSTFCPLPCPPNSHFTECAPPCPSTCSDLHAPTNCRHPTPCVEGCACDRGYVLSDYTCVPMHKCGCLDSEREYHESGDTWVTSDCLKHCTCLGGGEIKCQPFQCLPGSQCSISTEGLRYCRPTTFHQCVISGDPHYRTFDNFVHHFQGRCTYTLTRTLGRVPEALEPLSVAGRNYRRSALQRFSFLREVYVEVFGYRITLMQGRKMAVNGVMVTPPYSPRDGLQITQRGRSLLVQTSFGFSASFDGKNAAEIVLPSTYQQRVGGLCGNYDGRRNNEYMKPDGTLTRSLNTFGNSWQVSVQGKALEGGSEALRPARIRRQEPDEEPESGFEVDCTPEQLAFVNGTAVCGALVDPAGPFSACHGVVSPVPFQESCVYDLCALFNDTELLCQDFAAYAQLCQEEGVDLGLWRQKTGCSMECPAHTSYQPCMSACPASCANLAASSDCNAPCVEGCASAPGYVLSGLTSVPYNQCGCSNHGQYHQINDTFMTEDCSQRCTCQLTGVLECAPAGCGEGQICAVDNYERGCFTETPCLSNPCQNEGTCQIAAEGFLCLCLEGYVGPFCEDAPLDGSSPLPPSTPLPGTSSTFPTLPEATTTTKPGINLTDILLGVFISLGIIIILTVIIVCICRCRRR
ncbi:zonadhesin [Liasis olivaceus]